MRFALAATVGFSVLLALPAAAQERSFNFALRGGVAAIPQYPGSDDYEAAPDFGFTFGALRWGGLNVGNGVRALPDNGLSFKGAFKVIGSRDDEDAPELAGLDDIDTAVELGFGLTYQETNWRAFGEVRKGVTGHSGVTGTVGADAIYRPTDRWLFTFGPRVYFGDDEYASTYFGVSAAEAGTSGFAAYDADGGTLGAGVELQGTYFLSDRWAVEGAVTYERLLGDAGDSPITLQGSDDQWRVRLGLSRVFTLNF
ncbi:MipA/OmpV family protein [Sulfitobacter sp. HNIBRBA3233]|uniref:MipA/OmpV family protein n=1 Tax=Sulfitobacter marinivivus TaxID=3158558 RepID=UPI0032DF9047